MYTELHITRGLPGCGKTYLAREWVAADPGNRARVNRDDAAAMMHARRGHAPATEHQITIATHAAIAALLADGTSVICDDTNLIDDHVEELALIAKRAGATVTVIDLRHTPLALCLDRNASRRAWAARSCLSRSSGTWTRCTSRASYLPERGCLRTRDAAQIGLHLVNAPGAQPEVHRHVPGVVGLDRQPLAPGDGLAPIARCAVRSRDSP